MPYQPIENYGLIGNLRTAALVGMDGSIDWLCLPNFDSPSIFAAILDDRKGGRFRIAPPIEGFRLKQHYWPNTNILITRFLHPDGIGEIEDYMPVGDLAAAKSADKNDPVPGVAQAAIQMGHYAGTTIAIEADGRSTSPGRAAFIYRDKGSMAIIGKAKAVAHIGRWQFGGFIAWLLWGGLHILFLIGFRNRLMVLLNWFWNWLLNARDARLITGNARLDIQFPRPPDFIPDEATTKHEATAVGNNGAKNP